MKRDRRDDYGVLRRDTLSHPLTHAVPAGNLLNKGHSSHQSPDGVGEQHRHVR